MEAEFQEEEEEEEEEHPIQEKEEDGPPKTGKTPRREVERTHLPRLTT